jgi:hypothetical protein
MMAAAASQRANEDAKGAAGLNAENGVMRQSMEQDPCWKQRVFPQK